MNLCPYPISSPCGRDSFTAPVLYSLYYMQLIGLFHIDCENSKAEPCLAFNKNFRKHGRKKKNDGIFVINSKKNTSISKTTVWAGYVNSINSK